MPMRLKQYNNYSINPSLPSNTVHTHGNSKFVKKILKNSKISEISRGDRNICISFEIFRYFSIFVYKMIVVHIKVSVATLYFPVAW